MFKPILLSLLMSASLASADEGGSKIECKARCWGAEKAAEGIIKGIDEVLQDVKNNTGEYRKKHDYLKDRLHNTERNQAAMRMLENDIVSKVPKFTAQLIKKRIAKHTTAEMCFRRCGAARYANNQKPTKFMHKYFMTVLTSLNMEELKKAFIYRGAPFDTVNVQSYLDIVAREMDQKEFDEVMSKAKDDKVVAFIKGVRASQNSFEKLRPKA